MLFSPHTDKLWDTWLVEKDGVFHLFYIRIGPDHGRVGPTPSLGEGWDGVSLATSTDLLHWEERGPVLEKHPEAAWLGTGMIQWDGARYVMNFSEERPVGRQTISFAVSDDLRTWRRLPEADDLHADERFYQRHPDDSADPLPRWDSLGVIPRADGRDKHLAVVCANALGTLPGACGTLGLLESEDGVHWDALPPVIEPGVFPSYEVPEHIQFGERHYVIFSTNSTAGPRFDPLTIHPHSGSYYVVADDAAGPYRLPDGDPMLIGHRMLGPMLGVYVGRPFRTEQGDTLLYHQWTAQYPLGSWGPPKLLVEVAPYRLALEYWQGAEALKGEQLVGDGPLEVRPLPTAGRLPVMTFAAAGSGVRIGNGGGASCAAIPMPSPTPGELADGRVVEATILVEDGRSIGLWIGRSGQPGKSAITLNVERSAVEIGTAMYHKDGASMTFDVIESVDWPLALGTAYRLRMLYRGWFLDVYLDDRHVASYTNPAPFETGELGLYGELATGSVSDCRVWAMA